MTLAFLDIAPAAEGHALVVPKKHADDLLAASADDAIAVMRTAQIMARRLEETLHPDGMTLFQANRPAGWQDVFHLHLHVVPRWKDDQLDVRGAVALNKTTTGWPALLSACA